MTRAAPSAAVAGRRVCSRTSARTPCWSSSSLDDLAGLVVDDPPHQPRRERADDTQRTPPRRRDLPRVEDLDAQQPTLGAAAAQSGRAGRDEHLAVLGFGAEHAPAVRPHHDGGEHREVRNEQGEERDEHPNSVAAGRDPVLSRCDPRLRREPLTAGRRTTAEGALGPQVPGASRWPDRAAMTPAWNRLPAPTWAM